METNYALLDLHGSSQVGLEDALTQFTQLRNYYRSSTTIGIMWPYVVIYTITNTVARATNRTLIAPGHPEYAENINSVADRTLPRIFPILSLFDNQNRTLIGIWETYRKPSIIPNETPNLIRTDGLPWNFVYCSVPKRQMESIFNFSLFTDSYDSWTWLCLILSFIFVSNLSFSVSSYFYHLSALLSPAPSTLLKKWGKSKLFVVWMLVCQILCTTYTGFMPGRVISPSPEHTLSDLTDLDRNNYTIIGEGSLGWIAILNSAPYRLKGKVSILESIYRKFPLRHLNSSEVVLELTGENNVALMRTWKHALGTANALNDLIAAGNISTSLTKKCYVGEELIPTEEIHFTFTPPGSHALGQILQRFVSTGIYLRWIKEMNWLITSPRVQDRVRVLRPTKVLIDKVGQMEPLKMKGRVLTIFALWGTCLIVCLFGFFLEFYQQFVRSNSTG